MTPPVEDSNEQPPEEPQEQTQGQSQDQAQDQTQDTQQDQSQNQLTTEPGTTEEPHIDSFPAITGKKYEAEKEFKEEHFESKNSQMKMCKTCEFFLISLFLSVLRSIGSFQAIALTAGRELGPDATSCSRTRWTR